MTPFGILRTAFYLSSAYEAAHALSRFHDRKSQFAAAKARAIATGRELVVVGDPDSGLHTKIVRAYDCGDVCIDLNGCPKCKVAYAVDITKQRMPLNDNSAVIFESCVLEYVDDLASAWAELHRVAGSNENYFGVRVSPWTFTSRFFGGAKWILSDAPAPHTYRAKRISDSTKDGGALFGIHG